MSSFEFPEISSTLNFFIAVELSNAFLNRREKWPQAMWAHCTMEKKVKCKWFHACIFWSQYDVNIYEARSDQMIHQWCMLTSSGRVVPQITTLKIGFIANYFDQLPKRPFHWSFRLKTPSHLWARSLSEKTCYCFLILLKFRGDSHSFLWQERAFSTDQC